MSVLENLSSFIWIALQLNELKGMVFTDVMMFLSFACPFGFFYNQKKKRELYGFISINVLILSQEHSKFCFALQV